jgi:YHS domain-containing protein
MKIPLMAFALAALSFAPLAVQAKPIVKAVKTAPLVCPVTGEVIPSIKDAAGHSVYKGKTYYFCCAGCKPMFDKDPAKYVHPKMGKAK